ncbi:MAG: hypothetical protein JWM99_4698 [Verrucomicrobiales bacterium]|jgi:hypothetical protein|nr:hypothetical protein [Verrucomicrobiales bacterium]
MNLYSFFIAHPLRFVSTTKSLYALAFSQKFNNPQARPRLDWSISDQIEFQEWENPATGAAILRATDLTIGIKVLSL